MVGRLWDRRFISSFLIIFFYFANNNSGDNLKNISIWKDLIKEKEYPKLSEDMNCDVLIIGGGITGISSLYHLKDSNLKVMLVEQNKMGQAVTGNSTGKLNFLQNDLIDKIRNNFNDEKASLYLKSQIDAIKLVVDIIEKEKIECDLEKVKAYLYTNKESEIKKIKKLEDFLHRNKIKTYKKNMDLIKGKYMIYVDDTYIFHPVKFIYELLLKNKFPVYENTSIKKIEKNGNFYMCYTDNNKIKAKYVVIASHYPYFNLPFLFPIKGRLEKSYLSASVYKDNPVSLISYSNPFISARNYKNYLVYLSNSDSLSNNTCDKNNFEELIKKLNDLNLHPDYLWSNIDIITNDGLPYIGKIKDNLFIGTGYNTWGLTNGVLAGKIISDMICGKDSEYINLFNPKRINFSKCLGMISDIYENIKGYVKGFSVKNDDVIYKDEDGSKIMNYDGYKVFHKCPHLGCGLIFNEVEKTFDCPCHGSRFDKNGKCISGPSNKDISFKKD